MMIRVNRYERRGRWYWRVFRGATLIARSAAGQTYEAVERDVRTLFPQWVQ